MRQLLQNGSPTQPTVTMLEDLHWLDDASAEFVGHMVDARAGARSLLLVNFRPDFHADWMQSRGIGRSP
jgi:hypothetical protein